LCIAAEGDLYLYITAQDEVQIYFDNQPVDINNNDISKKWQTVKIVKIPRGTRVLGVKATNYGTNPGLLASITGDRILSDGSWKFTTSAASNDWATVSFNDAQWKNARVKAVHGGAPWNVTFQNISKRANWIWADTDAYRVVYFRVQLGL
jgi:hypothetical protein